MDLQSLPELWRRAVEAIVSGPVAWLTVGELAAALGADAATALDALAELDAAGWVSLWEEAPGGMAATLTPLASEVLSVHLAEYREACPRWIGPDDREPCPRMRMGTLSREAAEYCSDGEPGPAETVAAFEHSKAPAILLGLSLSPFPGPSFGDHCPACDDSPRPNQYCLVCDRSGSDRPGDSAARAIRERSRAELDAERRRLQQRKKERKARIRERLAG